VDRIHSSMTGRAYVIIISEVSYAGLHESLLVLSATIES